MKKTVFIKNAAILTVTSFLLRFAGIFFKVWLAKLIGSEGIGLYQLVFSVYVLAATFATSGIGTAVTRLVAETDDGKTAHKVLRRAVELTLAAALVTVAAVYFGAEGIARVFLNDGRAVPALKILPLSLPFMGISACLRGYFIARRRVTPGAVSQLFEQAVRIVLVFVLVKKFVGKGLAFCCAAVLFGDVAAEGCSCALIFLFWIFDKKRLLSSPGDRKPTKGILRGLLHISLPLTSGRYLNTALRTAENILVPKKLGEYAAGASALSQFGMIKGMALPILFFPSTLLNAVSTLLVPEMSEAASRGQKGLVRTATHHILKLTAVMAFLFGAVFFVAGNEIGMLIYHDQDVGFLLHALSPIVPFMYLDSVSDGILKGLDQQGFTFRTAVSDSVIRIALILVLLPVMGLRGFILIMYFSNFLTCGLNVGRLVKVSGAKAQVVSDAVLPLCSALTVVLLCNTGLRQITGLPMWGYLLLLCLAVLPLYLLLLIRLGAVTREELAALVRR